MSNWHHPLRRPETALLFAAAAAAAMLGVALVAQYGFSLHPCELCMLQRYPYFAIIVIALAAAKWLRADGRLRTALLGCALLFLLDAGIASYHAGVESGVFKGPSACTNTSKGGETLEEMRQALLNAPLVSCDQAMTHVFGLSMAAWNAVGALVLGLIACLLFFMSKARSHDHTA